MDCNKCKTKAPQTNCEQKVAEAIPLSSASIETDYIIVCNPKHKYVEMGMSLNASIRILKKSDFNRNLIVAVGDARYIISKNIAKHILVTLV